MDTDGLSLVRRYPSSMGGARADMRTRLSGPMTGYLGFGEAPVAFVSHEDRAFSLAEQDRIGTDIASNIICYGISGAEDCADKIAARCSIPHIRGADLETICAVCSAADIVDFVHQGAIPIGWSLGSTSYAAIIPSPLRRDGAPEWTRSLHIAGVTTRQEFGDAFRLAFSEQLIDKAANGLFRSAPGSSASRRLTGAQSASASVLFAILAVLLIIDASATMHIASGVVSVYFLAVVALRAFALWPPRATPVPPPIPDRALPYYSVLVPLHREAHMFDQLLEGLCALNYPAALLDIKIILEAGDHSSLEAIQAYDLPGCFEVIVVPPGAPQTKPRALNFALPFAVGELLAIYDAEDIPEPEQLQKAAARFAAGPENLACLQAGLTYYNSSQNWLTRQFSLEYASLFDIFLPALSSSNLPLPLGGTSNHFRTRHLRDAGGWDAHNVTEDADLGMRLDRLGYRVHTFNSTTYEEAVSTPGNWLRQRSRWMKGWMQTWLVHMRNPVRTWREMGAAGFAVLQMLVGGMVVSALVHPLFLVSVFYGVASGSVWPDAESSVSAILFGMHFTVLVLGYAVSMQMARRGAARRGLTALRRDIWTMPIYWLLMSVAVWMAVWQLFTAPFYWEKTQHGQFQKRQTSAR